MSGENSCKVFWDLTSFKTSSENSGKLELAPNIISYMNKTVS